VRRPYVGRVPAGSARAGTVLVLHQAEQVTLRIGDDPDRALVVVVLLDRGAAEEDDARSGGLAVRG